MQITETKKHNYPSWEEGRRKLYGIPAFSISSNEFHFMSVSVLNFNKFFKQITTGTNLYLHYAVNEKRFFPFETLIKYSIPKRGNKYQ